MKDRHPPERGQQVPETPPPLCPLCDAPTKRMGSRGGRVYWYCLGCECEFAAKPAGEVRA